MIRRICVMACATVLSLAAAAAPGGTGTRASTTTAASASVKTDLITMGVGCKSTFCYVPGTMTVKAGTKVVWVNVSAAPHTVTGVSGGPSSGVLLPGFPYSFTFHSPGVFTYYCTIHGFNVMHGTVVVT